MINELVIKNFAIIDQLTLSLNRGLNIVSGETGAGKSIIISAVNLLLGKRASTDIIRAGQESASCEASFNIATNKKLQNMLTDFGLENSNQLIIKRTISQNGKNKIFINGSIANLGMLQKISYGLLEIAAQNEARGLQAVENHIHILDNFGNYNDIIESFRDKFLTLQKLFKEKSKLEANAKEQQQKIDYLTFQLKEINSANIKPGEDTELENKRAILANKTKIEENARASFDILYGRNGSIQSELTKLKHHLEILSKLDPSVNKQNNQCETIGYEIEDLSLALRDYQNKLSQSTENLDLVEERLFLLNKLKRKYGPELKDVIQTGKELKKELSLIENLEAHLENLEKQIKLSFDSCIDIAKQLHKCRQETALALKKQVEKELNLLAMEKTKLEIAIKPLTDLPLTTPSILLFNENGMDEVEFLCSTNPGEPPRALGKIASGGELSRFTLAFKCVLSSKNDTTIYIFDEIDSGISGAQAEIVGKKIKAVSKNAQVICITHLPQIASQGDFHFHVSKETINKRTQSKVRLLNKDERIHEISRMLSGINITQSAIDHAKHLISYQK